MGPEHIDRHLEDLAPATNWFGRVRNFVYRIMFETPNAPKIHHILDQFIIGLIVASVIAIVLEHVEAIHEAYHDQLAIFDQVSVVFFTAEYALRLFCADLNPIYKGKKWKLLRYMLTPMALLDFFVVVPFYLTFIIDLDLRFLRILRLLRIFKLARFLVPKWIEFKELNKDRTFRQQIYSMLNEDAYSGDIQHIIDVALVGLIFFSVVAVVTESVESIHEVMEFEFHYFDRFSVFVFSLEYVLRVYTAVENPATPKPVLGRIRYMVGPTQIIDLLSVLPFYLTLFVQIDLRFLRVMRLLRILKLTRYSTAMTTVIEVITEELPSLGAALFVLMLITIFSASVMYLVEHEAQPDKFTSIPEAMYWAIITLTSIGYGDISPVTPLGQFLTMIMACVGLGMIALPTGILATGFNEKLRKRAEAFKELVEQKAADGVISDVEQKELDKKANEMGLSRARERQFEEEAIKGLMRASATVPGLAVTFEPDERVDAIFRLIEPLTLRHKSILLARLAISLPSHSISIQSVPAPQTETP
jgi:voltage-gated potassium channel